MSYYYYLWRKSNGTTTADDTPSLSIRTFPVRTSTAAIYVRIRPCGRRSPRRPSIGGGGGPRHRRVVRVDGTKTKSRHTHRRPPPHDLRVCVFPFIPLVPPSHTYYTGPRDRCVFPSTAPTDRPRSWPHCKTITTRRMCRVRAYDGARQTDSVPNLRDSFGVLSGKYSL